uniref:kelch domain-containing protein 10-like n=1 Tax=Myxine glutinosa TaxID=7769 RepID=UPI00358DD9E0
MDVKAPLNVFTKLSDHNTEALTGKLAPSPRSGHRCIADAGNLFVFGGYNPDYEESGGGGNAAFPLFRELWRFHFATRSWQRLETEGYTPKELASMSMVLHRNNLLTFGGTGVPFGESSSNDVRVCQLGARRWSLIEGHGHKPSKIYGQAMAIINGFLYVFGGTTGFVYNTDLHRMDLQTHEWVKLDPINAKRYLPGERYRHEIAHDEKRIYVLGGGTAWMAFSLRKIDAYNLETNRWEVIMSKPHHNIGENKSSNIFFFSR